ncbi:type II toxin-antitoxin system VapB family antitoxin [Microbacterium bovistercoris]|nr:type II toxin-antitoxin system VapB family antitoxin [Microbacterium bovistercoris]
MKTTIDLPDALAAEAKALAVTQRTTLRELVVEALRTEVRRRQSIGPVDFVFPTMSGHGLVADLAPSDAIARSYGLPE